MTKSQTHQLLAAVWLLVLFLDVGLILTILILGQPKEKVEDTLNGLCTIGCGCIAMSAWNAAAALWAWATTHPPRTSREQLEALHA